MLHLLFNSNRSVLSERELTDAGVHCDPDSRQILADADVVMRANGGYKLSKAARKILGTFTVAQGPETKVDIRVDYPEIFVVMPFNEVWSDDVYADLFKAAATDARFEVKRGDNIVRVGDLSTNVWLHITQSGVIVADVSVPNPNVYYEIGLADALGKPVFIFKQRNKPLPADLTGVHYYEYDLTDLAAGRAMLANALEKWAEAKDHRFFGVKALMDGGG
jgi:hypothetical protein